MKSKNKFTVVIIMMNNTEKVLMSLSSLSIYKGVLGRSVPKAFYSLLKASKENPESFLQAYGEFLLFSAKEATATHLQSPWAKP